MVENDDEETLPEKCSYSELLWSAFSRIWTECGEILRISPYSVRMRENADQNNSEYGHFSHKVVDMYILRYAYTIDTCILRYFSEQIRSFSDVTMM